MTINPSCRGSLLPFSVVPVFVAKNWGFWTGTFRYHIKVVDITLAAWACFPNAIWGQFTLIPSNGCVLHSGHHKILCPWATRGRYQWWRPEGYLSQAHTQVPSFVHNAHLSCRTGRL